MSHKITWEQALQEAGYEPNLEDERTRGLLLDSVQPACCDEGCEVEPDGRCEHGCPSVSLALGII